MEYSVAAEKTRHYSTNCAYIYYVNIFINFL